MTVKVDQPSEAGEYDPVMQTLLQLLWGEGFLSPGGAAEVECLLDGSTVAACRVLDIGCGLGAVDELLITRHGAQSVLGVDIDPGWLAARRRGFDRAGLGRQFRTFGDKPVHCPFR